MKITNNSNGLVISIPKGILDIRDIQDFIDFVRYKMIISKSEASEEDIGNLIEEITEDLGAINAKFTDSE